MNIYIALDAFNFYSDPIDFITLGDCSKTGKPILLGKVLSIDTEKHIIEYIDCGEQKTKSLHNDLKEELSSETKKTIQFIENEYLKYSTNQEKDKNFEKKETFEIKIKTSPPGGISGGIGSGGGSSGSEASN